MGGPVPRGVGARGRGGGPKLRADVRHADPEGQDRSTRCPGPAGGLSARRVSPHPSAVRRAAACAGPLGGADAVVRTRPRSIALTRALLRQHGWRVPTGSAETFSRRVMALPLPGRLLSEVAPLLAIMRTVNQQLAYSEGVIEAITRPDVRVQRLRTVPSVGPVTAAAFVATIDDAQRFHRTHEVE